MIEKIEAFFREKRWKNMKKADWAAIALLGVLLLIIAIPTSPDKTDNTGGKTEEKAVDTADYSSATDNKDANEYAACLEKKLENILGKMEGAGKVKVMITLSDSGEKLVEKDENNKKSNITETDADGGNRKTAEQETENTTVYVENGNESYPYVGKEVMPTIEGVVVVCEGGGNSKVVSDISDTVMALFRVEAHKIKVVKMSAD